MPGMPIFQDSPSQLKGQIFVQDSTTQDLVALQVDATGSLSTALVAGTTVGLATGTNNIGTVGLAAGTNSIGTVGLAAGTNSIGTVALAANSEVGLATGTTVGLATGTNNIGTVGLAAGTNSIGTVALAANSEVALATGTTVGLAAGTNNIGTVGLAAGTNSIGTVALAANSEVALATGTTVGLAAGTSLIGIVQNQLVFTNLDAFGAATPLTAKAVGIGATVSATSQNISQQSSYNWFINNQGTAANQNITLVVEISPDGTTWMQDTGSVISVAFGESKMITVTNFLQFARFTITGGSAATTVISSYQAQH